MHAKVTGQELQQKIMAWRDLRGSQRHRTDNNKRGETGARTTTTAASEQ